MTLLLLALAAAPVESPRSGEVAVLVVRRTSITNDEARAYASAAVAALRAAGVAVEEPAESLRRLSVLGVDDPTVCAGRKVCVLELAKQLEVGAVVAISAAALQQERSVVLDALRLDGTSMAKDAAVLKAGAPLLPEQLMAVSRALAPLFPAKAAATEPPKKDAPVAALEKTTPVTPKPEAPASRVELTQPPPAERSHAVSYVTGGLAVAAAVTSVALGVVAFGARSQATSSMTVNGEQVSSLPASRAKELAGQANTLGAVAGGAAGVAVALGVVTVFTW